jgi:hypothetical protein
MIAARQPTAHPQDATLTVTVRHRAGVMSGIPALQHREILPARGREKLRKNL